MSSLKKLIAGAIASIALIISLFAVAAPASAAPTPAAAGMQVTAANTGDGVISYDIANTPVIPVVGTFFGPQTTTCTVYLIDAIRGLPVIGPRFLNSGSDAGTMDLAGTLPALLAMGAVAGGMTGGQVKSPDANHEIRGSFGGVGMGVWIVGTVCNLNKFANSGPVLMGPGTGLLGAGSLGAGALATGSMTTGSTGS